MARCTGTAKATGQTCRKPAVRGATVCEMHGAGAPQVRRNAAVRAELARWTLGDPVDDPGHTLLRLITQSRMRAETYAAEVERLIEDHGRRVAAGQSYDDATDDLTSVLTREATTYDQAGKTTVVTGEYVRQIVQLEAQERDRCARFCKLAIDAGLAERMVRVAERQGELVAAAVRAAVGELELDDEMRRAVMAGVGRHLRSVSA